MADQKDVSGKVVSFSGSLTIDRMQELRKELVEAFSQSDDILLNIGGAENADVSFIQLLYAASKEAARKGKTFHLSGKVSDSIIRSFVLAGVTKGASTDAEDLEGSLLDFSATK